MKASAIVLFDGVCNFCNRTVRFIAKRDDRGRFRFASLQSTTGARLLEKFGKEAGELETLFLIEGDRCHDRSSAALRILGGLRFPWSIFRLFLIVPKPVRDFLYRGFAKRRYRWFGRQDACPLPPPDVADRFLD